MVWREESAHRSRSLSKHAFAGRTGKRLGVQGNYFCLKRQHHSSWTSMTCILNHVAERLERNRKFIWGAFFGSRGPSGSGLAAGLALPLIQDRAPAAQFDCMGAGRWERYTKWILVCWVATFGCQNAQNQEEWTVEVDLLELRIFQSVAEYIHELCRQDIRHLLMQRNSVSGVDDARWKRTTRGILQELGNTLIRWPTLAPFDQETWWWSLQNRWRCRLRIHALRWPIGKISANSRLAHLPISAFSTHNSHSLQLHNHAFKQGDIYLITTA